jgi:hypothetical protein
VTGPEELRLEAEARQARDRLELHRARTRGAAPASPVRIRELERNAARAAARLRRLRTVPENN